MVIRFAILITFSPTSLYLFSAPLSSTPYSPPSCLSSVLKLSTLRHDQLLPGDQVTSDLKLSKRQDINSGFGLVYVFLFKYYNSGACLLTTYLACILTLWFQLRWLHLLQIAFRPYASTLTLSISPLAWITQVSSHRCWTCQPQFKNTCLPPSPHHASGPFACHLITPNPNHTCNNPIISLFLPLPKIRLSFASYSSPHQCPLMFSHIMGCALADKLPPPHSQSWLACMAPTSKHGDRCHTKFARVLNVQPHFSLVFSSNNQRVQDHLRLCWDRVRDWESMSLPNLHCVSAECWPRVLERGSKYNGEWLLIEITGSIDKSAYRRMN